MNRAIVKEPEVSLHYPLILISMGMLPGAVYASALANDDGDIVFSWVDNTCTGTAKEEDKVLMVAYFPETKTAMYEISASHKKRL